MVKAAELRKLEQGEKTMEEFIQEFKRAVRGSGYERRLLVEDFKKGTNGVIRRKLMEAENQPGSIEQWYKRATALDWNWRESKCEKETNGRSSKAGATTDIAMTLSVAEEANAFSVGDNRACSDKRSRENEYSSGERIRTRDGGFPKKESLYDGSGQRKKLLCLQRIWEYGLSLQKLRKRKCSR